MEPGNPESELLLTEKVRRSSMRAVALAALATAVAAAGGAFFLTRPHHGHGITNCHPTSLGEVCRLAPPEGSR